MSNELIVKQALSLHHWTPGEHMDQPLMVRGALEQLDQSLLPAKVADPKCQSPDAKALRDALGLIGNKIDPRMSPDQAKRWTGTMILSLADMPYPVSIRAARDAFHQPIEFFSQVDAAIRECAKPHESRYRLARGRLERLIALIAGASKPKLTDQREPAPPLSQADVDAMDPKMIKLGLRIGALIRDADGNPIPNPEPEQ